MARGRGSGEDGTAACLGLLIMKLLHLDKQLERCNRLGVYHGFEALFLRALGGEWDSMGTGAVVA
jgi:hypothetical protein